MKHRGPRLLTAMSASGLMIAGLAAVAPTAQAAAPAAPASTIPQTANGLNCIVRPAADDHDHSRRKEPASMSPPKALVDRVEQRTNRILRTQDLDPSRAKRRYVPIYFHIMMTKNGDGNTTKARLKRQVRVLRRTFNGRLKGANLNMIFKLKGVDRYRNTAWHYDRQTLKMKRKTRVGGRRALNVWLTEPSGGILGYATWPWDYMPYKNRDGVVMNVNTLPGGSGAPYNQGKTLTHELGHWLGLYHTFQDGCSPGDRVKDTAPEAEPAFGCTPNRDTCKSDNRKDPVHNYMDYSDDACMNNYTRGQRKRVKRFWLVYRAYKY